MVVDPADLAAIQQLYALYGHVMDDRDWPRLGHIFADDCVFDASALGVPVMEGLERIAEVSASTSQAPLAHHVTNVFVESIEGDRATVRAKALGAYSKGRAFSGEYRDELTRTGGAWRISRRVNRPVAKPG